MRRPGIGTVVFCLLGGDVFVARGAALPPSADPVAQFVAVADSLARADGEAGLSSFVKDNPLLVGAGVARLLDNAFQAGQQNDAAAEKEHLSIAKRIALAGEKENGSAAARSLVQTYSRWSPAQRAQRAGAMALEQESGAARKAGDVPKAVDLLTRARAIYEKIGDRHSVAVNWGSMGVAHWSTGDWDVVIADYDQALAARRAVEDRILEGRTLNGLGSAYQQKGQWDRAADYYRQAVELRSRTGDLSGLGTSITYLGHVYYHTGRYVDARRQYEQALPILEAQNNPQPMVDLLSGIATVNASMGRLEDANDAYRRAIELAVQNQLGSHEAALRRSLADNYRDQGRFSEALDELDAAEKLLAANPSPAEEAYVCLNRGITYMNMGELDNARDDLLRSAELAGALDDPSPAILAQINIGFLYRELGAFDRALKAADQARELAEKAADARRYREAMALRGELQFRTGRYDDALASWNEALAQDQADGAGALALADEVSIAGVKAAMGDTDAARVQLRSIRPRARAAGLPMVERSLLFGMGHSFETENPDSAVHYYELALAHIESAGTAIGGAEVQTGYLSGKNRYYFEEVARYYAAQRTATHDTRWTDRAFATMERAKARGLRDLLQASVAGRETPEEDAALDALYSLDPKASDYADQRASLEKKYTDLRRARIGDATAGLAHGGSAAALDDVARALPGKTVLFEYALGDSASLVWVVDRGGSDLHVLPPRSEIEAEVRRLRDSLARVGGGDAAMLASARTLYRMLLGPGRARLARARSVVVVPDGALFELPFEVLLESDPVAGGAMGAQPFLARTHVTTYAPSAAIYAALRSSRRAHDYGRDLFAVGNPDFSALAPRGAEPLAPLPFAENEVHAIGARVKDARKLTLTGASATEAAVKKEMGSDSPRVVHLATHGLVDATEPARSSVALAPGDGEDGYLHTLEIISTRTKSDLVVMSACESASGRVSRGEGVVGLSRAFLGAGAGSVVASLWAVSDESTAELMRVFYDRMFGKKHAASRALSEARLALLDGGTYSHPFFWSPFIVTGTERSPW